MPRVNGMRVSRPLTLRFNGVGPFQQAVPVPDLLHSMPSPLRRLRATLDLYIDRVTCELYDRGGEIQRSITTALLPRFF